MTTSSSWVMLGESVSSSMADTQPEGGGGCMTTSSSWVLLGESVSSSMADTQPEGGGEAKRYKSLETEADSAWG